MTRDTSSFLGSCSTPTSLVDESSRSKYAPTTNRLPKGQRIRRLATVDNKDPPCHTDRVTRRCRQRGPSRPRRTTCLTARPNAVVPHAHPGQSIRGFRGRSFRDQTAMGAVAVWQLAGWQRLNPQGAERLSPGTAQFDLRSCLNHSAGGPRRGPVRAPQASAKSVWRASFHPIARDGSHPRAPRGGRYSTYPTTGEITARSSH